jgi:hypothetical protein
MNGMRQTTRQPWISFILTAIVCHAIGTGSTTGARAIDDQASRSIGISAANSPVESQCIRSDIHRLAPALNLKQRSPISSSDALNLRFHCAPHSAEACFFVQPFSPTSTLSTQHVRLQI